MSTRELAEHGVASGVNEGGLRGELKLLVVQSARLAVAPEQIDDEEPLFGGRLGLDSLDFIELAIAIEERFAVVVGEDEDVRAHFATLGTLARFVHSASPGSERS